MMGANSPDKKLYERFCDTPQAQGAAPLKGQPNETPMTDEVAGLYAEVERLKRCVGIERRCKESALRTIDKLQAQLAAVTAICDDWDNHSVHRNRLRIRAALAAQ